jgi:hypothetical protein
MAPAVCRIVVPIASASSPSTVRYSPAPMTAREALAASLHLHKSGFWGLFSPARQKFVPIFFRAGRPTCTWRVPGQVKKRPEQRKRATPEGVARVIRLYAGRAGKQMPRITEHHSDWPQQPISPQAMARFDQGKGKTLAKFSSNILFSGPFHFAARNRSEIFPCPAGRACT